MFEIYIRLRINLEIKSENIDRDSVSWSTEVCNLLQSGKLGLTHLGWECILKAESVQMMIMEGFQKIVSRDPSPTPVGQRQHQIEHQTSPS